MERRIMHADADSFFLSVEVALRPELLNRPCAVSGGGRGVILSASYPAREYGVKAGMPVRMAQEKCPKLQLVQARHEAYVRCGYMMFTALAQLGGILEQVSVDEAYWDITKLDTLKGSGLAVTPKDLGLLARGLARERFNLPLSVGVAGAKSSAKIACGKAKPDGILIVDPGNDASFLAGFPVGDIPGVGPVTLSHLTGMDILTIGQLAKTPLGRLERKLGQAQARHLQSVAKGEDTDVVTWPGPPKSVGAERTFPKDITGADMDEGFERVLGIAYHRLLETGMGARTVSVHHRSPVGIDTTKSFTLQGASSSMSLLAKTARNLHKGMNAYTLRLAGVSFGQLSPFIQEELKVDIEHEPSILLMVDESPFMADMAFYGMEVQHATYGIGIVRALTKDMLTVEFADRERLMDPYSGALVPVENPGTSA